MRGLLLSEFIDVENCLGTVVSNLFQEQAPFFHEYMIYKSGEAFSFTAKAKLLQRVINNIDNNNAVVEQIKDLGFSLNNFQNNIVNNRNILAHAHPEYIEGTGKIELKSATADVTFDGE